MSWNALSLGGSRDFTREPECSACTGISAKNAGELLEDCFEVTGFHAQLEAGKEIVRLHGLRCELRCLEAELSGGRKSGSPNHYKPPVADDLPGDWRNCMSEEGLMFEACDRLVREFEAVIERPVKEPSAVYYTGVDGDGLRGAGRVG